MRLFINSLLFIVGPMFVIIGLSAPTAAQEKTPLQQDRNLTMKVLARSMNQLKNTDNLAVMEDPATAIVSATNKLSNMWPEGSGGSSTRAKSEIWDKMADFKAKMMNMQNAADKLVSATGVADLGVAKSAFSGVGRTCGACHKLFRKPKV